MASVLRSTSKLGTGRQWTHLERNAMLNVAKKIRMFHVWVKMTEHVKIACCRDIK